MDKKTKFYVFFQNNSGGYFIQNGVVDEFLIIESTSKQEAINKMYEVTRDYSEFCSCCGMRWDSWDVKEYEKKTDINEKDAVIHYLDGNIKHMKDDEVGN